MRQGVRSSLAKPRFDGATSNLSRGGGGASWRKLAGFCWSGARVFSPVSGMPLRHLPARPGGTLARLFAVKRRFPWFHAVDGVGRSCLTRPGAAGEQGRG